MPPVNVIGVIGAGTMGSGIAQVFAQAGLDVRLEDTAAVALDHARRTIESSLSRFLAKGTLTATQRDETLARLATSTELETLADVDYVIEAILEDTDAKRALFGRLDVLVRPSVILASNTSSISITTLGRATRRPARVVGMHFMNPAPIIPLVEVIRGTDTSEATMAEAVALARRAGKTPVEATDSPGFISNRILMPMINEAIDAVLEGVGTPEAVDAVMKLGMNHPIGPLALADLIGLDVCLAIMDVLHAGFQNPKYRPSPLLQRMVAAGQLGRKSGKGFYEYTAD